MPELLLRLASLLSNRRCVAFRRPKGGYTPAQRWVVRLDDGSGCFVKTGVGRWAERLRDEHEVYTALAGSSFLPRLLAWDDDGVQPILVLEDLSAANWPPPWTEESVDTVLSTLATVRRSSVPGLRRCDEFASDLPESWSAVERDPKPFLSLGLCTSNWLAENIQALDDAARAVDLAATTSCTTTTFVL